MKENVLRIGRLYLFLILGACFSIHSCNSDDEDEIVIVEKTFLEKYDGTKWVAVEEYEGYIIYLRVNDNPRVPFELWGRPADLEKARKEEACYGHQDGYMDADEGDLIEIIENSGNRFTIGGSGEYWGLEIRGETLKFGGWRGSSDSNIWNDPESWVFAKTTVNVDAFEICPDDYYESAKLK